MKQIDFIKANISENMTIYVTDKCDRSEYPDISNKLMAYSNVYAEQVGFIEKTNLPNSKASIRLQMMGGEFCGNATRGVACLAVRNGYCKIEPDKKINEVIVESSGMEEELKVEVEVIDNNIYNAKLYVTNPLMVEEREVKIDGEVIKYVYVELSGITHTVFFLDEKYANNEFYTKLADNIEHKTSDAFGFMIYDEKKTSMHAMVYVKGTDSMVYERSCGSGSIATACASAYRYKKDVNILLIEEGGNLEVSAKYVDNKICNPTLKGEVIFCCEGKAYIDE